MFTLMLLPAGCGQGTTPNSVSQNGSLTLVLSGDTAGFIVPCGCATKQFGGLPRRATCLEQLRKNADGQILYLDAGGSVHKGTRFDRVKLEFIWRGMKALNPVAMNLGSGEVSLGLEALRDLAKIGLPLLSANVLAQGAPTPWPDHIETSIGGLKIAIAGICTKNAVPGAGLRVTDPETVLRTLLPALSKEHDAVILLAYASNAECQALLDAFPEASAVLAAGTSQPVEPMQGDSHMPFTAAAQKGKFMPRMVLSGRRNQWTLKSGSVIELSESFADDPAQIDNLNAYKSKLKADPILPAESGEAPKLLENLPSGYGYALNESCAKCHENDAKIHAASHHAGALKTLAGKNFEFDPYCLKCHSIGYGAPGGFMTALSTPGAGGVGCESCHGPSQAHAHDPKIKTTVTATTACATCHDSDNSPHFDYNQYWPRIQHSQKISASNESRVPAK